MAKTREEKNADQKVRRAKTGNWDCKKYEKTPKGFLMRAYRNMQSRVTGVQKLKAHLYLGLELLPRQDFYAWAEKDKAFQALFAAWVVSDYDRRLTPSIDRIDTRKGYALDNIRWLTHSENSSLGGKSPKRHSAEKTVIYKILGVTHA